MLGKKSLEALAPLLETTVPNSMGELGMWCPYHGDRKRSASMNIENGLWYCETCGQGGQARALIADAENWVISDRRQNGQTRRSGQRANARVIECTEAEVEGWHSNLLSNREAMKEFRQRRGINLKTVRRYQIGYDSTWNAYTIPIRDARGELVNIRFYVLDPKEGRRKIWSVAGRGEPHLFPFDQLENNTLMICEGEWDALLSIQNGVPAVTRTSTADAWDNRWNVLFRGKRIIVCHDMDDKGQRANDKLAKILQKTARSVRVVTLPYSVTTKEGKDLTDYWLEGHTKFELAELVNEGTSYSTDHERLSQDGTDESNEAPPPKVIGVMDSFDANLVGTNLLLPVTVAGKRIPSYLVPVEVAVVCEVNNGKKCESCAVAETGGTFNGSIDRYDPVLLGMIGVNKDNMNHELMSSLSVQPECTKAQYEFLKYITVEELYVRPSIELDRQSDREQDFTHRKVISSATHDLLSNQTVDLHGSIYPGPANQQNEFLAWNVVKPVSMFDDFEIDQRFIDELSIFKDATDPLGKLYEIAEDLSMHVTKIYHRNAMHVFMDLVFHSCLMFDFGDERDQKGWLDGIIIGDTRTGKSEVAKRLVELYGVGEMISCESATYAGVVGGLDRTGDGKWIVKWGSIPVNDRRIVVMDEISGLTCEQIAQMSAIRSSGIAEMTKIQTERANARTRLLWLANPRGGSMTDKTFGVQSLKPLIGNNEDLARFDIAMGVFSSEVPGEEINRLINKRTKRRYPQAAMRQLVRWAWTRKPDDIVFAAGVREHILDRANYMGGAYMEDPPLVQVANIRLKLARVAIAVAMRTFSTDATGHQCIVTQAHVDAAEAFFEEIYSNPRFGYLRLSEQKISDVGAAKDSIQDLVSYIANIPNLMRFLVTNPRFNRRMLDNVMNMSGESVGALISDLWTRRVIEIEHEEMQLQPHILDAIRERV